MSGGRKPLIQKLERSLVSLTRWWQYVRFWRRKGELLVELPQQAEQPAETRAWFEEQEELRRLERQIWFETSGPGPWIKEPRLGNKLIAQDENLGLPRELWRLDLFTNVVLVLHLFNHSLKPDGSREEYWLVVPNTVRTPHEAVAHSFGFDAMNYKEAVAT